MFCERENQDCSMCPERLCELVLKKVSGAKVVKCNVSEVNKYSNKVKRLVQLNLFKEGGVVN